MRKPILISVVNHKGGVLKTSLTANLGAALARMGKKVLLVDLDAQQNLTSSLIGTISSEEGQSTLYDDLIDEVSLDSLIRETPTKNLDIIPVTEEFAGAELSLAAAVGRESILKNCLQQTENLQNYDFVFFDNPPSISLVVMNSLVASDYFLVPCSAEYLPMVGLTLLGNSIGKMRKLTPHLSLLGIVLTSYAKSERICRQVESTLRKEVGENLFKTKVRVNTKAKAAPSVQQTIFDYENNKKGRGTVDYSELAVEFLERVLRIESGETTEAEKVAANG
jgi:chromosome partitioning protein